MNPFQRVNKNIVDHFKDTYDKTWFIDYGTYVGLILAFSIPLAGGSWLGISVGGGIGLTILVCSFAISVGTTIYAAAVAREIINDYEQSLRKESE